MVRFSRKEDYGVLLISRLAHNYNKRLMPLSEVAKEHKISLLFLRNVALELRLAGLISAVEGKHGGYKLNKDPQTIYFGEIIQAFSKDPIFSCCQKTKDGKCRGSCPHGFSLRRLNNIFLEKMAGLKMDELMSYK